MRLQRTAFNTVSCCAIVWAICALLCGCHLPGRGQQTQEGIGNYEQASISYDVSRNCAMLLDSHPYPKEDQSDIAQVAFDQELTQLSAAKGQSTDCSDCIWKTAQLSIQYPHPAAIDGMAQATLRLSAQSQQAESADPSTSPLARNVCNDELWVLDIPKPQLDQVLSGLSSQGFFQADSCPANGLHLDVSINETHTQKTWNREPQLDHFVKRVYEEGQLRGFIPCNQTCKVPVATPRFPEPSQRS